MHYILCSLHICFERCQYLYLRRLNNKGEYGLCVRKRNRIVNEKKVRYYHTTLTTQSALSSQHELQHGHEISGGVAAQSATKPITSVLLHIKSTTFMFPDRLFR